MFFKVVRFSFLLVVLLSFLTSCSEYTKVLKSNNVEYKLEKANEYYAKGEYSKALPLFEELIALYRGTATSEDIYYKYAYCHYYLKDYFMAGYYFKNYVKTYAASKKAEECLFVSALCSYKVSPISALDQSETVTAINDFQLFLNRYPNTPLRDSANVLITSLQVKLEDKAYQNAKLYLKTENFKSAVIAFENLLKDFPGTPNREEIEFLIVKTNYLLAMNSVDSKKAERFNETIESYMSFVESHKESKYKKEAEGFYNGALRELDRLTSIKL